NPPADQLETLTVETPIPTVSSPVPTACFTDSPEPSSDTRIISKIVANQVETPSLDNILTLPNRFEDLLEVTTNSVDSDGVEADVSNMETTITASPTPTLIIHMDHPKSQIIGPVDTLIQTRNKSKETLVDCLKGVRPIGTKCILKDKKDERGIVIGNKARLVARGHTQEEGIDYDKLFVPVARIKAIRLFLAYASFIGFTAYQIDVKSAFLYGTIDEEVYVMQPPGFQDLDFQQKCIKWRKQCMDYIRLLEPAYSDSDYGGATQDRKSTTRGCQFLGRMLISWQYKKQTIMATSTTEAEYVAAASCYGQVLWIQNQLLDYGDCFEKKLISVDYIHTDENVADLLTKHFDAGGTSKYWGVLRILMISLRLIPLEAAGQDVKKDVSYLRYIVLQNWFHEVHLESSTSNAQDTCSVDAPESSGNSNPTATLTNPLADHMETLTVETPIPTVSSLNPTACFNESLEPSSDIRLISKRVTNQDDTPSLDNILTLTNRFEDILGFTTNTDDTILVEADLGNMETTIIVSPTPTLIINKDHLKSQIIGPVDTPIQTRNKSKEMEEQSFIATIHQKTNPALL
nr:retrovirus-related Pol polyprotein from transposon TNT 1-94 [Tanacetum cinerariifolium]